jgi:hypothetical protein
MKKRVFTLLLGVFKRLKKGKERTSSVMGQPIPHDVLHAMQMMGRRLVLGDVLNKRLK